MLAVVAGVLGMSEERRQTAGEDVVKEQVKLYENRSKVRDNE
jgi:hypothetical protein